MSRMWRRDRHQRQQIPKLVWEDEHASDRKGNECAQGRWHVVECKEGVSVPACALTRVFPNLCPLPDAPPI